MDSLFLLVEFNQAGRMFALDPQTFKQMVFIFFNVAVLALILAKILYQPVLKILRDRRNRILSDVEDAEKNKAAALQLKADYEQLIKGAEQEKYSILENARKQAAEMKEKQIAEAKTEAETVKSRAQKEIEMEQERVKSEMKQTVIDVSSVIAAKFLAKSIDSETHERLFNETMAELEDVAWLN